MKWRRVTASELRPLMPPESSRKVVAVILAVLLGLAVIVVVIAVKML